MVAGCAEGLDRQARVGFDRGWLDTCELKSNYRSLSTVEIIRTVALGNALKVFQFTAVDSDAVPYHGGRPQGKTRASLPRFAESNMIMVKAFLLRNRQWTG